MIHPSIHPSFPCSCSGDQKMSDGDRVARSSMSRVCYVLRPAGTDACCGLWRFLLTSQSPPPLSLLLPIRSLGLSDSDIAAWRLIKVCTGLFMAPLPTSFPARSASAASPGFSIPADERTGWLELGTRSSPPSHCSTDAGRLAQDGGD